jgi:hypothetical protein
LSFSSEFSPGGPFELRLLPSTSAGWPLNKEDIPWTRVNSTNIDINATKIPENFYDPPIMDLTVLNSTSILVNWSEPPRPKSLHLKGYRLTYSTEVGRVEDFVFFGPIYIYDYSEKSFLFSNFGEICRAYNNEIYYADMFQCFLFLFSSLNFL